MNKVSSASPAFPLPLDIRSSPGLSTRTRIIPLHGFSGCQVFLVDDEKDYFVRKLSRDIDYNARLLRQAEKQKNYDKNEWFEAVKIRASGYLESGLAYIDMDYLSGVTAAEDFQTLPLSKVQNWAALLVRFSEVREQGKLDPSVFQTKISSLQEDLAQRGSVTETVARTFDKLRSRDWANIPQSSCHGDLTLENIITHDGRLYLIDFLDSFTSSWYLDMAKVLQDLIGGWSFRHTTVDRNMVLRLASLRHTLEGALEVRHPGCLKPILDLYVLGLLRILPYCSSFDEQTFVESRLRMALDSFL